MHVKTASRIVYTLFACLYLILPHSSFFSLLFPHLSHPLVIFSCENIDPLRLVNACYCCVRFSFFRTKPRDWLGETSPKWPVLCRVGRKTTTQAINQSISPSCIDGLEALCFLVVRLSVRPTGFSPSSSLNCTLQGDNVASAGWQVTPCNSIWRVSSRSGEASCELLYSGYIYVTLPSAS